VNDRLEAELPRILEEHKNIFVALRKLDDTARLEKKMEDIRLAEKLKLQPV
jgi:hypothetical protein